MAPATVFYHGGRPGLKAGDLILPPSVTGHVRAQQMLREASYKTPEFLALGMTFEERRRWWMTTLEDKDGKGYHPDRAYVTVTATMAQDAAAGWANWAQATAVPGLPGPAAADLDAALPVGHVYEVEPCGNVQPDIDWWPWNRCCCLRNHGKDRPCSYSADSARIIRPLWEVQASQSGPWMLVKRALAGTYREWKEVSGREWFDSAGCRAG